MWPNLQFSADLVKFSEEPVNMGNIIFYAVCNAKVYVNYGKIIRHNSCIKLFLDTTIFTKIWLTNYDHTCSSSNQGNQHTSCQHWKKNDEDKKAKYEIYFWYVPRLFVERQKLSTWGECTFIFIFLSLYFYFSHSLKILQHFNECRTVFGHYVLNEQRLSNDERSKEINNNNTIKKCNNEITWLQEFWSFLRQISLSCV